MDIPTMREFNELKDMVGKIMSKLGLEEATLMIKDLAIRYGCSYNHIKYSAPWLMPNFGKSDFSGATRWLISTVRQWEETPVLERKLQYLRLAEENSRKLIESRK